MNRENDLRERYIYAATRGLPRARRADIEQELRTLIDDLLEERCAGREPTEKDLRVVLTDLGTPAEIREKYNPRPARGCKVTGATAHLVTAGVDEGPILLQKAVDVLPGDTPEILQRRVMEQAEWLLLPRAVRMLSEQVEGEK